MVHEVMVLDHSGFDLGIIKTATNLKFVLFSTLSANCLIPQSLDLSARIVLFLVLQTFFAAGIGWLSLSATKQNGHECAIHIIC